MTRSDRGIVAIPASNASTDFSNNESLSSTSCGKLNSGGLMSAASGFGPKTGLEDLEGFSVRNIQ